MAKSVIWVEMVPNSSYFKLFSNHFSIVIVAHLYNVFLCRQIWQSSNTTEICGSVFFERSLKCKYTFYFHSTISYISADKKKHCSTFTYFTYLKSKDLGNAVLINSYIIDSQVKVLHLLVILRIRMFCFTKIK